MTEPRYSLIIPAYNEASRISRSLTGYLDAFEDSEVLLVLNGCTDDTERVAREAASAHSNLRILRIEHAVGKGGAVRAGFLAASAPVVGYVDADGATAPQEMRRLFDLLSPEDDAVIASRWSKGAQVVIAQPILRRLSSRVFNALVRVLFGLPFSDTQCGAKVFSSAALHRISTTLEVSNFAFDIDLLYSLRRVGCRIREVPTRWHDIGDSRINLAHSSREMLSAILRLRLRHSLFRYVIPLFDRLWPTTTLRVRHGLAVLILGLHDPHSPHAEESERYLQDVGASLVRTGHRVHWLAANFANSATDDELDGIAIKRVGNRFTARAAIPQYYVRNLRNRFDVVVEVQHGLPLFTPFFSLKPKLCLTARPPSARATHPLAATATSIIEFLRRRTIGAFYRSARFIAMSGAHERYLNDLGVEHERIEKALDKVLDAQDARESNDVAATTFLNAVYEEVSRTYSSYVLSGKEWAIVPRQPRIRKAARPSARVRRTETLL